MKPAVTVHSSTASLALHRMIAQIAHAQGFDAISASAFAELEAQALARSFLLLRPVSQAYRLIATPRTSSDWQLDHVGARFGFTRAPVYA